MQNASDISFELLGEKESGGGGMALVLLSWKAAAAELCCSADTRRQLLGRGTEVWAQGLVYTQKKETM